MILGAIAIIGIIGMQSYWVLNTWNVNEEEFHDKVTLALHNVAKSLAKLQETDLPPRNIVKQRTSNYYVVNIESEIDANSLEYYLQTEFEALALNEDFEYAVFDCTTDEMVYGNYCSYTNEEQEKKKSENLPKYDEFTYYFGVKFPNRWGHLFSKIQLSIFFSIILLFTIAFFAYSMFVILRQKRLSEMQKDFINNMTHEFKTPISTIKISADVFINHPQIKEDRRLFQYANIIKEQNNRLNTQVEKVLQLARIERGNFKLKKEKLNLQELLNTIIESARVRVEKLGGELFTNFHPQDHIIKADPLHLSNILHNLLDNAIKYCKEIPNIIVSTNVIDQQIHLTILDEGIGIEKNYHDKVFDKFYRVPTGNVHNVKGFGLGLFYVKNICLAHGWKIRLKSEEGKGTNIKIIIPNKN